MRWKTILLAFGLLLNAATAAHTFEALSVGFGVSPDGVDAYRIEAQKGLGFRWLQSETGFLSLSIDGALDYWDEGTDDGFAVSLAPFVTYRFKSDGPVLPFVEAGVGASYITETRLGDQNLGIHFQFEDILGFGLNFGERKRHGLRFRAIHYSNANLDSNNDGLTFYTLSYHFRF